MDAPVLLTHGKTVHPELQAELTRLGAKHLLVIGGDAARNHAPLLLTKRDDLRNEARAYFTKAGVKKVILIGGTNAITDRVVKDMK